MLTNDDRLPVVNKPGWPWKNAGGRLYSEKTDWPKISIVTPSFNQGQFIEETIRSVLLQGYPNLEYIIIDGGSTDDTVNIIKKYERFLTYWISEPDRGQSHAINKGLQRCTGDIFNWLNSDDWYMPDTLFEIARAFSEDPSLQIVSGFENNIGINGEIVLEKGTFLTGSLEETIEFCQVAQPSTFFRLNAIKQIGGVAEDLHYIMDGEMWVRLLLWYGQSHFLKKNEILVNFRLHENSKTVSNEVVNNFLYERTSIITDLQRFIGLPEIVIDFYISNIYKSPKSYRLNRSWKINESVITKRRLRIYFIKKYIVKQFLTKNMKMAYWGLKQLVKERSFDLYLVKGFAKLLILK